LKNTPGIQQPRTERRLLPLGRVESTAKHSLEYVSHYTEKRNSKSRPQMADRLVFHKMAKN
jgi:hypothetical protein